MQGFLTDYSLSTCQRLYVAGSLGALGGLPYAERHWAKAETHWLHYVIATIEICPVIGGLAALVEYIAYAFFGRSSSSAPAPTELIKPGVEQEKKAVGSPSPAPAELVKTDLEPEKPITPPPVSDVFKNSALIRKPPSESERIAHLQEAVNCHLQDQAQLNEEPPKHVDGELLKYAAPLPPLVKNELSVNTPIVNCTMARLPNEILNYVGTFLRDKDRGHLAQVARFARNAEYALRGLIGSFKEQLEELSPMQPLSYQKSQTLFVGLVTSPISGHPHYWTVVLDEWMKHLEISYQTDKCDPVVHYYSYMADLLATSTQPIFCDQIFELCKYFKEKISRRQFRPWIGYRIFEYYALQLNFAKDKIYTVLKEYLTQEAQKSIRSCFKIANISFLHWFGTDGAKNSLWLKPGAHEGQSSCIPDILVEVLTTHIKTLSSSIQCVELGPKVEASVPHNFVLLLVNRITNEKIHVVHRNTINDTDLEHPEYASKDRQP